MNGGCREPWQVGVEGGGVMKSDKRIEQVIGATPDAVAADVRIRLETMAASSISARGRFSLALTGGSAAEKIYPALAFARADWSRVDLFFGDERMVPLDHADSNCATAVRTFVNKVAVPASRVHRVNTGLATTDEAARAYAADLTSTLGVPPALDVIHLGLGEDGHVCSLFPAQPRPASDSFWVMPVEDSPKPPPRRVSFTFDTIAVAREIWFLVLGAAKADIVRRVRNGLEPALPAAIAMNSAQRVVWFLDEAAASKLNT